MHPDRGIVRTFIRSDGLYTRPEDQNTLTHQPSDTKYAPEDLPLGPVTQKPAHFMDTLRLCLRL